MALCRVALRARLRSFARCHWTATNMTPLISLLNLLEDDKIDPNYSFKTYLGSRIQELENGNAENQTVPAEILQTCERFSTDFYKKKYSIPPEKYIGALGLDSEQAVEIRKMDPAYISGEKK